MKNIIMRDELFEESIRSLLEKSKQKCQNLLNEWNGMGLNPITTASELYELIWRPDVIHSEAVMRLKAIPPGLTPEQETDFLNRLKIPSLYPLEQAANQCKMDPYCLREQSAFSIKGKSVIFGPGYETLVMQKSVICTSKEQENLGLDILELQKTFNSLNQKARGRLSGLVAVDGMRIECDDLKSILEIE